ncbi:MAG TPA: RdgB/HAM1 family non-canonical purine NTP pyrophosphatase [Thermomicrobiales bacterium]|nr:RdgB/HAM1 family non-canonical purine NTP pyrophosphatase [Thermomicrobiales bacterium]
MCRTLLLATSNPGKIGELRVLLGGDIRVVSLKDVDVRMPVETGETFRANAELKAVSAAAQSGLIALADDSGLEVDALEGRPGVRSARFAGVNASDEENRARLHDALQAIQPTSSKARFVCAVSVAVPDGSVWTEFGTLEGQITHEERGRFGFGYDRMFELPDGRTLAEVPPDQKNRISHRGRAMSKAVPRLLGMLNVTDLPAGSPERQGHRS